MIHYHNFDIKDLSTTDTFVLLHGVNRERKMGKGIALDIRNKWPQVYQEYLALETMPQIGSTQWVELSYDPLQIVVNCFTQNKYRRRTDPPGRKYASLTAIIDCLVEVGECAYGGRIPIDVPILMPPIGCANGGLNWSDVQPIVEAIDAEYLMLHNLVVFNK